MIFGDEKGYIKIINLNGLLFNYYNYFSFKNDMINPSYNLLKKEEINSEIILNHLIKSSDEYQKFISNFPNFNLYKHKLIHSEFKAFDSSVTDIVINEPLHIVTIGTDGYMKIFKTC